MITTTKKLIRKTVSLPTRAFPKTNHEHDDDLHGRTDSMVMAPLRIPYERRLQMGSIVAWLISSFGLLGIFLWLCTRPFWLPIGFLYLGYVFSDRAPLKGGRPLVWVREWSLWKYIVDYFPIKIIKEQDLDPSQKYLFGCHPHGIACFGPMVTFATEATGFSKMFPGINVRLATLPILFMIPFYRELILSMGMCSISRASCDYVLSPSSSSSLAIVVGGATEALTSQPGTNLLILKKRLGFLRLAIRHHATLVPVFSFGETDIYCQSQPKDGSFTESFRHWMKQICGISFPLFHARGIFNYDFGLVPYRKPVTIIVGKPIPVPILEKDQTEPTKEQLLELQDIYIKELTTIYDKYKDIYAKDRHQDLKIIA